MLGVQDWCGLIGLAVVVVTAIVPFVVGVKTRLRELGHDVRTLRHDVRWLLDREHEREPVEPPRRPVHHE